MPTLLLTAKNVNPLPLVAAGQVLYRDADLRGFGLRVGAKTKAYFVEKRVAGRTVRHTLGVHGVVTADEARRKAIIALGSMASGADLNALEKEKAKGRRTARAKALEASERTLAKLCAWYVGYLESLGKRSAKEAQGLFRKYVEGSEFADVPASEFTPRQATALLRRVIEQGKGRTAAKLRSYLRAAYSLAQGAETNPQAPADLVLFGLEVNPVAATGALSSFSRARDMVLTGEELGELVRRLRKARAVRYDDGLAALELGLQLAGQRPAQVLRVDPCKDVDLDARTIVLMDPKGRRKQARRHILPLAPDAVALVKDILAHRRGGSMFGAEEARTVQETVSAKGGEILAEVRAALAHASGKPHERDIQVRDIRRTAETMLAAMGISKDIRAQLQSHGLGGVQNRHYDRHDYMDEKLRALQAWEARLNELAEREPAASNVRTLERKTRAAR
jgi:integrase